MFGPKVFLITGLPGIEASSVLKLNFFFKLPC